MIDSITRITLNLQETNTMVSIRAKRGDTGRKLLIHLSDGSIPYHISDDCYATFTAKKPDNTKINNACTIENNVIEYEFTDQTCTAAGTMKAEIRLYGADNKMITSACFLINVYDTVFRDGDEVFSEGEMNVLNDLILRANAFLNETGKLLRWHGNWDSKAEYEVNDLVLHQQVLYVAEDDAAPGTMPGSNDAVWVPIAGMGTGSGGNVDLTDVVKSVNGVSPDENGNVDITVSGTATAIDYDQNVHSVNHRGYSASAPENTIPAYILSKQMGFTYVEADVSFTSDGVAVLLHDATIDRTSNGSGSISAMTYAEASKYDYGSWKNTKYTGTRIPTFEEFIILCKRIGLHPYIEMKKNGAYTQAQIQALVEMVKNCGMDGKVTWISFADSYLGYVKSADPSARLGYLVSSVTSAVITTAQGLQTDTNEVFIDSSNYDADAISLCQTAGLPLEIWTINSTSTIQNMNAYITGVTSDNLIAGKILHDAGMVYEYGIDVPENPATSITLSATTLSFASADAQTLTATVEPPDTTDTVVWSTSASSVATVNGGVVTPVGNGTATITVTAGSVSAECSVTVNLAAVTQYTVTNNLTNVVNSNNATVALEGSSYTANISAAPSYIMESVVVTMGGVNVTATVYAGGVVTIPNVTGNIVITATAALNGDGLLYKWDFTKSLTDSVQGVVATHNVKLTESGFSFEKQGDWVKLGESSYNMQNKTVEIDVASMTSDGDSDQYRRMFCIASTNTTNTNSKTATFLWGGGTGKKWTFYGGTSWAEGTYDDSLGVTAFDGKTVHLYYNNDMYCELIVDGVSYGIPSLPSVYTDGWLLLGGSNDFLYKCGAVISGLRIYEGRKAT